LAVAGRLWLGDWAFEGAPELACLLLVAGSYFRIVSRRYSAMPDPASLLELASQEAASGRIDRAIERLTETIRWSPHLWQALQYRGELYLRQGERVEAAIEDFSEAIRLAPGEAHLYVLRGRAYGMLGDDECARRDQDTAAGLGGAGPVAQA